MGEGAVRGLGPVTLSLDDVELRVGTDSNETLDVLFDGRRVWSITATEYPAGRAGVHHIAWPEPIRRHLDGLVTVELREHVSGEVVARTEVALGSGQGRVEVVDSQGRPVALTKYGRLNHPFESTDRTAVEGYLDQVEEVLAVLREECGLPAFISYGTLLGAVRNGRLIGHDVDVDLGYLSAFESPVDVVRETLRVERVLRSKGWRVVRENNGFLALFLPQADGTSRNMDVFACFIVEGTMYQIHDIGTPADRSAVLPLGEVELEGRNLAAPAQPEVFLQAAYGPGWRVPDPSFEYHTPRSLLRHIGGWLGGLRAQRDQWIRAYDRKETESSSEPCAFAAAVADRTTAGCIIDLGCGTGADAVHFAGAGLDTYALDFAPAALRIGRRAAKAARVDVGWRLCNLYSLQDTLLCGADWSRLPGPRTVYTRALPADLTPAGRDNFWRLVRMLLAGGGRCYLEVPTTAPRRGNEPPRRSVGRARLVREAERHGGRMWSPGAGGELPPADPDWYRLVLEWA